MSLKISVRRCEMIEIITLSVSIAVFLLSLVNVIFSMKMKKATHELNTESKNIIYINNNINNHEFYKMLYDELLDVYRLYEDVVKKTADEMEPHYNDFGTWDDFKESAMYSKDNYEGIGIDYDTFEKVKEKLDSIRYCLPNDFLKQLEMTKMEGRREAFSYYQAREEIPKTVLSEEHFPWIEKYCYDKDKKLFLKIEEL
ncbi:hypothetical protein E0I22_03035, partial [Listeria monocytogenes]|nr:hypothetical protein [Listeria monocytogenes]